MIPVARFPFLCQVGVGGLEPPTSASQTRRAGRLRYTPADKSIIRSMSKGQVSSKIYIRFFSKLILSLIILLSIIGCSAASPSQTPEESLITATTEDILSSQETTTVESTSQNEPLNTPTPNCLAVGGNVQEVTFFSDTLMADFSYKVYLPPCYQLDNEKEYPVLILLHGLSYDNQQWLRLGLKETMNDLIQREEISPFIVVLPQEDRFDPPELSLYGEVLVNELLPHVEKNFPILNEKTYRGIGGLSRGAAWAVRIGFEHHELFSKVGAHSLPLFKADVSHVQTWLNNIPKDDLPLIFLDIGRDDPEWDTAQAFADQLDQRCIPHEWYLFNQGHSESYWADHIAQYLQWYGKDW